MKNRRECCGKMRAKSSLKCLSIKNAGKRILSFCVALSITIGAVFDMAPIIVNAAETKLADYDSCVTETNVSEQVTRWDFSYQGAKLQKFTALVEGDFQILAQGARGGGLDYAGNGYGGAGGNAYGVIHLKANETIYIAVGQYGGSSPTGSSGGWNGGGANLNPYGAGGGGATCIYSGKPSGSGVELKDYKNDKDKFFL